MLISDISPHEKLRNLLENSFGSRENPWISKLEAEKVILHVAAEPGIPLDGAKDIFSRRGRRNQKLGNPISGFEYLLRNLDSTDVQTILIHEMVDNNEREYRIFTDPEITKLIGLLKFPKERLTEHFVP